MLKRETRNSNGVSLRHYLWTGGDLKAWHQDLIIDENGNWDILVCAYEPEGNNNAADLYYIKYSPSLNQATAPKIVLQRGF